MSRRKANKLFRFRGVAWYLTKEYLSLYNLIKPQIKGQRIGFVLPNEKTSMGEAIVLLTNGKMIACHYLHKNKKASFQRKRGGKIKAGRKAGLKQF